MTRPSQSVLGPVTRAFRGVIVVALMGAAMLMVAAILGGLARMGVVLPGSVGRALPEVLVHHHGPLMVSAFFGTVISMERAVAVRTAWSYVAPVAAVSGGVALVALSDAGLAAVLFSLAAAALVGVFAVLLSRRFESFTLAMALGAVAWAAGNVAWMSGVPVSEVVPFWASFLVLTIVGERLELSRFRGGERSHAPFWAGFGVAVAGLVASLVVFDVGMRLLGGGFIMLAAWLVRHDIARSTIRLPGAPRFMASALLAGYFWLTLAGVLAVIHGGVRFGLVYDALWHAIFMGFVFSMVFAHAQVILPALSGLKVRHGARFYVPLLALHLATLLRVVGDLGGFENLRRAGGIGGAAAVGLFMLVLASSVRRSRRRANASQKR
ncbi:hypothetical protein FRC98_10325 [Lujinxingia vulgaris]|uniref:NnrS family protein n=1 Tax=Lujinxingia vulgaris TaxID=2600176 RepID=A0A5C6XIN4_9DELT|nr:hypothetical protein [Lujinxingia vulgaris]TXD37122.1 hypothetical protein FRC98_10325 [Lujinxingia vulgaris]